MFEIGEQDPHSKRIGSDDMLVPEKLYPCKAGLEFYKTQKDVQRA
jgi:hypothetical protein